MQQSLATILYLVSFDSIENLLEIVVYETGLVAGKMWQMEERNFVQFSF